MASYLTRRLAIALLTALGCAFIVFSAVRMLPGDTVDVLLQSGGYADVESREDLRATLGLDEPLLVQFGRWIGGLLRGDFGESMITKRPIGEDLKDTLPVTLELGIMSVVLATVIGVPLGVLSAVKQNSVIDYVFRSLSVLFLSVPGFLVATAIIVFGSLWFDWAPPLKYNEFWVDPVANIKQLLLPALLLGLASSAGLMRFTRTAVLEVVRQDFVRTARAKGLHERSTIFHHVLRNAVLPVITVIGIYLAYIVGGSIIFEQIFQLPGMGRFFFNSVAKRDYTTIQAIAVIYATFVVLVNLLTDVMYAVFDPRIRYE